MNEDSVDYIVLNGIGSIINSVTVNFNLPFTKKEDLSELIEMFIEIGDILEEHFGCEIMIGGLTPSDIEQKITKMKIEIQKIENEEMENESSS